MKLSNQSINKSIKILLFFLFIVNTAAALWTPIFSIFILDHIVGATLSIIGLTSAIYSVVRSVLQIPIAKYLDSRAGEKTDFNVIFTGIVLAIVCSFAFLVVKEVWQLGVIQIFWGVADACTMAAYYSIFSHHIDRKSAAFEWSLYSVGGITIAVAIGGLIGGFVAQYFGFSSIFIAAGSLNVLALILLGVLKPHMKIMREVKAQHLGKIIIGLTGTHGSGKGEVVEYLKEKGFVHYSAREFIYKEIDKRNLPRNRDSLNQVSNDLRSQFGPEYVAFSLYEQACKVDKPSNIE